MFARAAAATALLTALALAPPAQAAPPADAFCVILIEGLDDFRVVRVLTDEETTVEERAALFPAVDRNGDGQVTRDEGDEWRMHNTLATEFISDLPPAQRLLLSGTVDGASRGFIPLYAATWRQVGHTFHKQDHEQPWPVTEPVDLETQAVREVRFGVDDATRIELRGGLEGGTTSSTTTAPPSTTSPTQSQSGGGTPEYVVVRAPAGWRIASVEGSTYDGWISRDYDGELRELDLPAFDTKTSPWALRFERTATDEAGSSATADSGDDDNLTIPAPGAALAVLLLALLARRRL